MELGKDFRYDDVVDIIESIGYKHRTANYYVIDENDGYINISYERNSDENIVINFHKNIYHKLIINGYKKRDISMIFNNIDDFYSFIFEYHNKLFRKHKIEKLWTSTDK